MIDHIDRVCQIAGNARHAGIGSDLDGGFGTEQTPADLDTIADLSQVPEMLAARGYNAQDVRQIAHGNFLRFLNSQLGSLTIPGDGGIAILGQSGVAVFVHRADIVHRGVISQVRGLAVITTAP